MIYSITYPILDDPAIEACWLMPESTPAAPADDWAISGVTMPTGIENPGNLAWPDDPAIEACWLTPESTPAAPADDWAISGVTMPTGIENPSWPMRLGEKSHIQLLILI